MKTVNKKSMNKIQIINKNANPILQTKKNFKLWNQ